MLPEADGLAEDCEREANSYDEEDIESDSELSFALKRLLKPGMIRKFDLSSMGYGPDVIQTSTLDVDVHDDVRQVNISKGLVGIILRHKLPLNYFRIKLIKHFNIAFDKKEGKQPQRNTRA